jgi:hypothetical protein
MRHDYYSMVKDYDVAHLGSSTYHSDTGDLATLRDCRRD